jgi:hypothetical protein
MSGRRTRQRARSIAARSNGVKPSRPPSPLSAARAGRGLVVCLPAECRPDEAAPFDVVLRAERTTVVRAAAAGPRRPQPLDARHHLGGAAVVEGEADHQDVGTRAAGCRADRAVRGPGRRVVPGDRVIHRAGAGPHSLNRHSAGRQTTRPRPARAARSRSMPAITSGAPRSSRGLERTVYRFGLASQVDPRAAESGLGGRDGFTPFERTTRPRPARAARSRSMPAITSGAPRSSRARPTTRMMQAVLRERGLERTVYRFGLASQVDPRAAESGLGAASAPATRPNSRFSSRLAAAVTLPGS